MQDHSTQATKAEKVTASVHETAVHMQEQFVQTGAYQAQDLNKVLGDPRESVSCIVPTGYTASMRRQNLCLTFTGTCSSEGP